MSDLNADDDVSKHQKKLIHLLKKYKIDSSPQLGPHFALYLDLEKNYDGVTEFLKKAGNLALPYLRKVSKFDVLLFLAFNHWNAQTDKG